MVMTIPTTMVIINSATIMKKLFNFVALAAIAATSSVSCQKEMAAPEQPEITDNKEVQIKVTADPQALAGAETRTYISNNTILWGTGEYMNLCVTSTAGETTENKWATSNEAGANGQEKATFVFSVSPQTAASYLYQGLYPASAAVASDNTNPANYKVNLPATQNASASSYDPAAYIMVAKPQEFTSVQDEWMASYRRATALNKITLKNLPDGVSIKRVVITAPDGKYLAGARHIDLSSGESGDIYSGGGRTESVEVKYETALSGTNVDVWFTSWDVEVAAGETLSIVAYTSDDKSYTKTIVVPSGKSIKFQEGYLNTLGASFSGITPDGVTVLAAGNYVVLAKDGGNYYAMKAATVSSDKRMASVNYTGSLDSYSGDADMIWEISKSGDSYIFANSGKYLGYSGSNNEAYWKSVNEWSNSEYLIDITWNESDNCYYATNHNITSRKLGRNSSSDWFAFYTSDQQNKLVFVPATVDSRTPVTLSFSEDNVSLTTANYNSFTGQQATAAPTVSPITYAMTGDAIGTITEAGVVSLNGTPGTATVTATFAGNDSYRPATASYLISVSDASVLSLSFPFTSDIAGWPTSSSSSQAGSYTYTLSGADYSFTHTKSGNGIYCSSSYLMIVANNFLGLPALPGYKLTSVSAQLNGGGNPSTAAIGKITSGTAANSPVVSGGEEQTFDTKGGSKTFTLSGTEENTVYYLAISNKNFQCTEIVLVYEACEASAPKAISFNQPSEGGTFTVSVSGRTITSGTTVAAGTTVTLQATPATDYSFNVWTVNGASVADASAANTTFTMGTSEVTISASFTSTSGGTPTTSTLTFTEACGGSGTADDGTSWTVASDGTESNFDNTKGIHYGTNSAQVQYIKLSTSGISGTITKVVVNASTASGVTATASVTVGGAAFGGTAQSLSTTATDYTFTGSASGEIVVTVTKPSKAAKAIYVKSVVVTYTN